MGTSVGDYPATEKLHSYQHLSSFPFLLIDVSFNHDIGFGQVLDFFVSGNLRGQTHIKNKLFADLRRDFHPLFSKLLWLAMKSWKTVWFHNCGISPLEKTLMTDQTVVSKLFNAQMISWVLLTVAHLIQKFIQLRKDYTRVGVAFWNLPFWSFLWNLQTAQLIEEFLAPKYCS